MGYNKYYLYKKQLSYDSGSTWYDVYPEEMIPSGDPIGHYDTAEDCGYLRRTVSSSTYCDGSDTYIDVSYEVSYDSGTTWEIESVSKVLIERYSALCDSHRGQYLTFIPRAASGATFYYHSNVTESGERNKLSYSLNSGRTWTELESDERTPKIRPGVRVMWKGNAVNTFYPGGSTGPCVNFEVEGDTPSTPVYFDIEGNIMSLLYGDDFVDKTDLSGKPYIFEGIFQRFWGLDNIQNLILPATTLSKGCYARMFYQCPNIGGAPSLPATTLAPGCYGHMFEDCYWLQISPILPAPILVGGCYSAMFSGCHRLRQITCLAEVIPDDYGSSTGNWVLDVRSQGIFYKKQGVIWPVYPYNPNNFIPTDWAVLDYSS